MASVQTSERERKGNTNTERSAITERWTKCRERTEEGGVD